MPQIEVFAPAKVNLTLHVTGQRPDGYHLLDSLVAFANFGDHLSVETANVLSLKVLGPFAKGVPEDNSNLCWRAAELFGEPVAITLDKRLPHPAGIGGGSSDAAAVLRAMETLFQRPYEGDALALGADTPVCRIATAARMQGIGDVVNKVNLIPMAAVLVNPGVDVPTPSVFKALQSKSNAPMTEMPAPEFPAQLWSWLENQRNDLEEPARKVAPVISDVLHTLSGRGARVVRMSGSGATCFALFENDGLADLVARDVARDHPDWWVQAVRLA